LFVRIVEVIGVNLLVFLLVSGFSFLFTLLGFKRLFFAIVAVFVCSTVIYLLLSNGLTFGMAFSYNGSGSPVPMRFDVGLPVLLESVLIVFNVLYLLFKLRRR